MSFPPPQPQPQHNQPASDPDRLPLWQVFFLIVVVGGAIAWVIR